MPREHWFRNNFVPALIVGIFLLILGYWLTSVLNPTPELKLSCYRDSNSVYLTINNPSKYVAEEYNLLIYEQFGGISGGSWAEDDLCQISYHEHQPERITSIKCDYVPPKTSTLIQINFENSSVGSFKYLSWGKTKSEENGTINCYSK